MASIRKRTRPGHAPDWRGRILLPNGERISHCAARKSEVEAWANEVEDSVRKGTFVDPIRGKMPFDEWVAWYLANPVSRVSKKRRKLRPSTIARDLSYINNHLLPFFKLWPLVDITTPLVQRWVDELAMRRAPATADKAFTILSKILDAAIQDGRLVINPCRAAVSPALDDIEARFLLPHELLALEAAMPAYWADVIPFLTDTGLRIGELAGLRVRDIDFDQLVVWVHENKVEVSKKISGQDTGLITNDPKTRAGKGRRIPTLTPQTAARIQVRCLGLPPDAYVFALPNGSPFRPNQFRARVFREAVVRAGLGDTAFIHNRKLYRKAGNVYRFTAENVVTGEIQTAIFPTLPEGEMWAEAVAGPWRLENPPAESPPTPHALRHTAVARWIAIGVTDKFKLKTWAGHRSIQTIDLLYGHLLPSDAADNAAREALSAMWTMAKEAVERTAAEREAEEAAPMAAVVNLADRRR